MGLMLSRRNRAKHSLMCGYYCCGDTTTTKDKKVSRRRIRARENRMWKESESE